MRTSRSERHDVVVVGARVAGAATAMLLARLGHDVVVVERDRFPSDTLSTHAIDRPGVVQLARWGLLDRVLATGAPAIRRVTIHSQGESVTRTIKPTAGVDLLVAPRRHVLDPIMAEAAAAAGADVRFGVTATAVRRDAGGRVTGVAGRGPDGAPVELEAAFVVGADGLRSKVARSVDAPLVDHRGANGATHYAYYAGLPWSGNEYVVGHRSFAGVFPTNDGEACIWVCTPSTDAEEARRREGSPAAAFDHMLGHAAPELAARLAGAVRTSAVHGVLRLPNQARRPHGPGWALVGDAGYHRDPITGHGISDAFRDAELLAVALDAALRGRLDEHTALGGYAAARDAARAEVFDLTCALAAYPPPARFTELQRALARAIEVEACALADRPVPGRDRLAVA